MDEQEKQQLLQIIGAQTVEISRLRADLKTVAEQFQAFLESQAAAKAAEVPQTAAGLTAAIMAEAEELPDHLQNFH